MTHHNPSKPDMNPQEHTDVLLELSQMGSSLAGLNRSMPFSVPDGYWAQCSAGALAAAHTHELELSCGRRMPYNMPEAYFEQLPGRMMTSVLPQAAPHQQVPEGYFDQLPATLMARLRQEEEQPVQPKARTIDFKPARIRMRWAAAAVLLAVMGLGIYQSSQPSPEQALQSQLAQVDGTMISNYIQETALESSLQEARSSPKAAQLASQLSADEIVSYLQESGLSETELY
jgi:hypothetical protein